LFSAEVMRTLDQAEPVKFRAVDWFVSPAGIDWTWKVHQAILNKP
tara:strand:+ start:290 stop:424 length:135 start_codon:yes stop_codon:yes gene_type:complete